MEVGKSADPALGMAEKEAKKTGTPRGAPGGRKKSIVLLAGTRILGAIGF